MCPRREKDHANQNHTFVPAYYGLLTGEQTISPDNEKTINAQRNFNNAEGKKMKIIIGSQVASEGVDLRFIRETHVIDSWFHLNKTEQILGRAIRYLSHCALPKEKRNNTVYLYSAVLPAEDFDRETADLYSYRIGFKKALLIGNVTRIIKQASMDCNLNKNAIIIRGQDPIQQIDSQRMERDNVNINDMPFTAVCDWIETCEYQCKPEIDIKSISIDDSTYDEFSARWHVNHMKERLRILFRDQSFYSSEDIWNQFSDIPRLAVVDLLTEIVDNKNFQVEHNHLKGYIRYCNGYYLLQPNVYADLTIPLAIRTASFPVKRDVFQPADYDIPAFVEEEKKEEENVEAVRGFWQAMQQWADRLSKSANPGKYPRELEQRILDMAKGNKDIEDAREQNVDAVLWFHGSFHKSTHKNEESFRKTILFYFWDEWLTLEEQKYLLFSSGLNVEDCIRDSQYRLQKRNGEIVVNRFLNPNTDTIEYLCEGKNQCEDSIVRVVEEDRIGKDTILFNKQTIGSLYGFVVPKKGGAVVFKTDEWIENKKFGGQECANSTNMPQKFEKLMKLGEILKESNRTDFELNKLGIHVTRPLKAAARVCTLMDLVLRFLHAEKIQDKKWFFRPIQAQHLKAQLSSKSKKKGK
jgi:hypothetical protein